MEINSLTEYLKDVIIEAFTPIKTCNPEKGILFMLPSAHISVLGSVYVGTQSDWDALLVNSKPSDRCTYLICLTDDESLKASRYIEANINLIFVNTTLPAILQRLNILLSNLSTHGSMHLEKIYLSFWKDTMQGYFFEHSKTMERLLDFPYPLLDYIACIVVRPQTVLQDIIQIQIIEQALHTFFPATNLFLYDNEWIIIYSQEKGTLDEFDFSYESFSQLLEQYDLYAGISYLNRWPELLRTLYLTASASIDLALQLKLPSSHHRLCTYNQYNAYYIIYLSAKNFKEIHGHDNLACLIHPDAVKLFFYDTENHDNLLIILSAYLKNGHNATITARILFMHRNTVINKLNRICEIIGHKLNNNESQFMLLLSCMILEYQCKYAKRKIDKVHNI